MCKSSHCPKLNIEASIQTKKGFPTHIFLLGLGQVVGERRGVVLVDVSRHLVKPCDEAVLDPVHHELDQEHHHAVGGERPEALCRKKEGEIKDGGGYFWTIYEEFLSPILSRWRKGTAEGRDRRHCCRRGKIFFFARKRGGGGKRIGWIGEEKYVARGKESLPPPSSKASDVRSTVGRTPQPSALLPTEGESFPPLPPSPTALTAEKRGKEKEKGNLVSPLHKGPFSVAGPQKLRHYSFFLGPRIEEWSRERRGEGGGGPRQSLLS